MIRGVMPKIDPTTAPEGSGSRYPAPFDASCKKRSWRRLGEAAGLTQFGVNLGHCESDTVETTKLPTFEPGLVFGGGGADGGGGKCFDTLGCFPNADSAELDMSDCTVPMPETASASKINVAFVPGSGTGICRPDEKTKCFVPVDFVQVDKGPSDGWTMKGGKIQLPVGFCDKIKEKGLVATVTVSTGCASKTSQVPTCGPWSAVGTTESGSGDAGPHDATVDVGEADGGSREPEDSGRIESDSSTSDVSTSTCGSGDLGGGVCNQMANVGEAVTPTCASGAPPTMTGGTIADGTYVMTAETLYGQGCGDSGVPMAPQAETYVLSGACLQAVLTSNGESESLGPDGSTTTFTDGGQLTETSSVSIQGNQLSLTTLCPVGDEETTHLTFTATAKTVTTVSQPSGAGANTISVQVFTKYNGSPK
jgi:hypothetical protein